MTKTDEPTTALATTTGGAPALYDKLIADNPITAIETLGAWMAKSRMLGVQTPDQGMVVAMTCLDQGITPLEFSRRHHIIEGRVADRADYMQATFQARGGRIDWETSTAEACRASFTHPELQPNGVTVEVTMAELIKAGVTAGKNGMKTNYKRHPRQMLRARVISEGVRMVDPSVNCGTYTPEEAADFEPRDTIEAVAELIATPAEPEEAPEAPQPPQEGPETGEVQPEPREVSKRAAEAVARFTAHCGVVREDLEAYLGRRAAPDEEDPAPLPAEIWGDEDFERLGIAWDVIKEAPAGEERQKVIGEVFQLPSSALEG